jgi:hypothetical protein
VVRSDKIRQSYPSSMSSLPVPASLPPPSPLKATQGHIKPEAPSSSPSGIPTPVIPASPSFPPVQPDVSSPASVQTPVPLSSPPVRHSTHSNKGIPPPLFMNQAYLSSVLDPTRTNYESELAYMADASTDFVTGDIHCTDPRASAAKHKINDPDMPSYNEAVTGPHAEEYIKAMKKEIKQLVKQKTWTALYRKDVPRTSSGDYRPILKGTWAFKLKRYPDGSPMKFKARYCVRGDLQREGIDYFDTYAPVVQWSTVRLVLTLVLANNWVTKQVDYTNAFAQAELKEEVYIECPRGFPRHDNKDALKLNNSLYGLKQAPKTFYEKLKEGLEERGFTASILDPCLFMKKDMI